MMNLNKAIDMAASAHIDQYRWDGSPYILHPIRVMLKMDNDEDMIVAVLHDVIEDTNITVLDLMEQELDEVLINAVVALTKDESESYEDYLIRVKNNLIARKVKVEDIKDNLDVTVLHTVSEKHRLRMNKYLNAILFLSP